MKEDDHDLFHDTPKDLPGETEKHHEIFQSEYSVTDGDYVPNKFKVLPL
jgi:hypothetical protein